MAIDVSRSYNNSDNTILTVAGVLAFIPFFGLFGIHDFIVRNHKNGGIHLMLVALGYAVLWLANSPFNYGNDLIGSVLIIVSACIVWLSYIWAIVEGVRFMRLRKTSIKFQQTAAINTLSQAAETTKESVVPGSVQTTYAKEARQYGVQNKKQKRSVWAVLSIVATIIPVLLWIYCSVISGGSTSENGPGAVWWLMVIYYWMPGIPLAIMSIAFGIVGLKTNLRWLSIVSLLIKAITIIVIIISIFAY